MNYSNRQIGNKYEFVLTYLSGMAHLTSLMTLVFGGAVTYTFSHRKDNSKFKGSGLRVRLARK